MAHDYLPKKNLQPRRTVGSSEKLSWTGNIYVRSSRESIEPHSAERVKRSLVAEAGLDERTAAGVAAEVERVLAGMSLRFVSGPLIREIACVKLLERGLEEARQRYSRVGMPVHDVAGLLSNSDNENANTPFNPDLIHKKFGDAIEKEYALLRVIPKDAADAHMRGAMHIHDLDYFLTRPFCYEHDLRFFLKHGIKADGSGVHNAVSGAPKRLDSAMMQAAKVLQLYQTHYSGGQGFDFFNVWMAPFCDGVDDATLRQCVERFVYELDQSSLSRGGQTAFTSITLEFAVPKFLQGLSAVLPGGVTNGNVYGDYEEEAQRLLRAVVETYMHGDALGKPFHFPKPEFKLREKALSEHEDLVLLANALSAKYGSSYFLNHCAPFMPEILQSQCCRYFLTPDSDYFDDLEKGTLKIGSVQTVTLNLPRIAYESAGSDARLFELLAERMEMTKGVFEAKRACLKAIMARGAAPLLSADCYGSPYFNIDKQTNSVGFVGLNEMLRYHTGSELHESDSAWRFGLKVMNFMSNKVKEMEQSTGYRFGLVQTPAESCAHRLALLDLQEYDGKAVVQGSGKSAYYTNSSHVRYGASLPLFKRLRIESSFHPILKGGVISHVFLSDAQPDAEALLSMTKKIAKETLTAYFAYTRDFSFCTKCGSTVFAVLRECPKCGAGEDAIQWYSRITGYYTPVKGWNAGKRQEFADRKRYGLN
jgi:ribonucleoside-triphosphate reductase